MSAIAPPSDACDVFHADPARVAAVRQSLPDAETVESLGEIFKALGDPVRLRLLSMVASRAGGEVCVCDLTPAFDLSQPTISHHLKLLKQAGLIDSERRGTWVYYRLLPQTTDRLASVLTRPGGQPVAGAAPAGAAS